MKLTGGGRGRYMIFSIEISWFGSFNTCTTHKTTKINQRNVFGRFSGRVFLHDVFLPSFLSFRRRQNGVLSSGRSRVPFLSVACTYLLKTMYKIYITKWRPKTGPVFSDDREQTDKIKVYLLNVFCYSINRTSLNKISICSYRLCTEYLDRWFCSQTAPIGIFLGL